MKIFGYNITKQQPEKREVGIYNPNLSNSLQYGLSGSKNTALSLSTVYSAVNLISDAIACLPITIKARNNEGITELDQHPLKDIFSNNLTTKYTLFKRITEGKCLLLHRKKRRKSSWLKIFAARRCSCLLSKRNKRALLHLQLFRWYKADNAF